MFDLETEHFPFTMGKAQPAAGNSSFQSLAHTHVAVASNSNSEAKSRSPDNFQQEKTTLGG